ncbi:MAG TPA: hypothetical protein ENJ97_05350 [Planctomycetes bacterium]|nr:hypothetical protein [Planctomycetota bacterium]
MKSGILFLLLLACSCTTTYFSREEPGQGIPVFPGDSSRPYLVVGHVSLHQSSFYLLGFLSLVPLDLPRLLKVDLAREVRRLGGDALLFAKVKVTPPGFPNLLEFPFIASSGKAEVSGLAVRWTGPPREKQEEKVRTTTFRRIRKPGPGPFVSKGTPARPEG